MKNQVFYLSILFSAMYGSTSAKIDDDESYCYNLSSAEVIQGLWNNKMKFTPLLSELKDTITSLLYTANDDELTYMKIVSLWTNDRLMGFDPEVPQSYVYAKMINATVEEAEQDYSSNSHEECESHLIYFRNLCVGATDNAVDIGLRVAGCPSDKKNVNYPVMNFSISKKTINKCFNLVKCNIPYNLQNIIKRLVESKNSNDKVVGLAGIATATDYSRDFFSKVQDSEPFVKIVKLKACNRCIASSKCNEREKQIKSYAKKLNISTKKVINEMLDD